MTARFIRSEPDAEVWEDGRGDRWHVPHDVAQGLIRRGLPDDYQTDIVPDALRLSRHPHGGPAFQLTFGGGFYLLTVSQHPEHGISGSLVEGLAAESVGIEFHGTAPDPAASRFAVHALRLPYDGGEA